MNPFLIYVMVGLVAAGFGAVFVVRALSDGPQRVPNAEDKVMYVVLGGTAYIVIFCFWPIFVLGYIIARLAFR